jgi:hypothetical protein
MFRVCTLGVAALSVLAIPSAASADLGICCFPDGSCVMVLEEECWELGGCAFIPGAD